MHSPRYPILIALCAIGSTTLASGVDFEREIRPILNDHCIKCHGAEKQRGSLRLDLKADAFHGGEDGPAIVPNQPEKSLLLDRLSSPDPDEIMPPPKKGEKLGPTDIAKIRTWIEGGAPWPEDPTPAERFAAAKKHWAFVPPVRPTPPGGGNPIDAFVSARLAEHGLKAVPEADRRTLLRRVTLDLTGLPPTPEELEAFLDDPAPGAYERVVDRLLASPHYGERWGRVWLDLARWAESDGYEANEVRPTAWRYRDYVVRAFNSDKPYDRFLREQIAGDELAPYSDEALIATGFLAAARTNDNEEDKAMQLNGPLVDITNTVASVTLGLTLGCAQCHDHKIEPLTARDYYSFHAFFLRGQNNVLLLQSADLWAAWERGKPRELEASRKLRDAMENGARDALRRDWLAKLTSEQRTAVETPEEERNANQKQIASEAQKSLDFSNEKVRGSLSEDDRKLLADLDKKVDGLEKHGQDLMPQTWAFYSPATSPNGIVNLTPKGMYPFPYKPADLRTKSAAVLKRGDVHRPDEAVTPAWPAVLGPTPEGTKTRSQFVDWLASPANPLTARVWANFIWQQHFGRGIVETSGDFGTHGAGPSNQELLDWLACELRENGWSTKHLQRLIVTSQTYRESSVSDPANLTRDPDNRWLWHWAPRRLEAEAIRDVTLAVAGTLDPTLGGPSLAADSPSTRRSIYLLQKRYTLPASEALFDAPNANDSCPRRSSSTVPLQALHLLNNPENVARAAAFAARVEARAGDEGPRIETAFRLALNRPPDETERALAHTFFAQHTGSSSGGPGGTNPADDKPSLALVHFCQSLLNLNEFLYLQ